MSVFEFEKLSYGYVDGGKKRMILNNLSYQFEKGKLYTILGPSGSGKTTLLALAGALDSPESGRVIYRGNDIKKIGYTSFRRSHIAIVFQKYNLTDYLTAAENVEANMMITGNKKRDRMNISYKLLDSVGIVRSKADRLVTKLSGGEQQRVAIARALAKDVELILGDEPTGALDTATASEIIELFKHLARDFHKTIILVTHSDVVAKSSDVTLRLKDGILIEERDGL